MRLAALLLSTGLLAAACTSDPDPGGAGPPAPTPSSPTASPTSAAPPEPTAPARAYVASLTPLERRSLQAMVSLDRVGVGGVVPVGSAAEPDVLTDGVQAAADRAGVPTVLDPFQRSSDHGSFVRDGLPGARPGSTPYAGYHSPGDLPGVVERASSSGPAGCC